MYDGGHGRKGQAAGRAEDPLTMILSVVGFAAEQFLRTPDWEAQIPRVLAGLGKAARASRSYVFTVRVDGSGLVRGSQLSEWAAPGITPQIDNPGLQDLGLEEAGVGRWSEVLGAGGVVHGRVADLPLCERAVLEAQDILAVVVVPVFVDGQWWGFIGFDDCASAREWSEAEVEALRTAANLLGAAIERHRTEQAIRDSEERYQRLFAEARRQTQELALLERVRGVLAGEEAMTGVFRTVVEGIRQAFGYDMVSLYLVEDGYLKLQHQLGYKTPLSEIPLDRGVMAQVAASGRPRLIEDVSQEPATLLAVPGISSEVAVPLRDGRRVVGVMNVETTTGRRLGRADLRLLSAVAEQLSLAFEREGLHRQMRESERRYRSVVESVREVIFQTDEEGCWSFLNSAWTELTGFAVEESLGAFFLDFVHPDDRAVNLVVFTPVVRGRQESARHELRYLTESGETRWAELYVQAIMGGGRALGTSGTITDITERVTARRRLEEQKRFYEGILNALPAAVAVFDAKHRYVFCNPGSIRSDEIRRWIIGKDDFEYCAYRGFDPELARNRRRHYDAAVASRRAVSWEERFVDAGGRVTYQLRNLVPIFSAAGELERLIGYGFDVTERKLAEERLEEQGKLLSSVIDNLPGIFYMFDEEGRRLHWNKHLETLAGDETEGHRNHRLLDFIAAEDREGVAQAVAQTLATGKATVEAEILTSSGERIPHLLTGARLELGKRRYLLAMGLDISERRRYEAQLEHLAYFDGLTGLPNRRFLRERAQEALRRGRELVLLYLDLDRFKTVNDTLGHDAGDALLVEIATRLMRCLRGSETLARLGGDEFALLLESPSEAQTVGLAERILAVLAEPLRLRGQSLHLSGSVGIARSGPSSSLDPQGSLDDLLKHADIAMYQAKASGGGYSFYDPDKSPYKLERFDLEDELRRAIAARALTLHYQPILDLREDAVRSCEALVRWPRSGALLAAGVFVPLAEESELIRRLDRLVLTGTIRQAGEWFGAGRDLSVALNLSARSLHDPELAPYIGERLKATGLPPERLLIEITESAAMHRPEESLATLHALRGLGVKLAIDDFGSGFASLTYLRQLPVDRVKIDRSLVQGLGHHKDEQLVKAAIALGHGLGLEVVAEGVETAAQLAWLREQGCDFVQGYLTGQPGPAEAL